MIRMLRWFALWLSLTAPLAGSSTAAWEMNTYQDFLKGRFTGVALTRDGEIRLAPKLDALFSSDQPAVWAVVAGQDGSLYLGTGHRGRVFRLEKSGKSSLYWTAEQPEVFALAVDARGVLYAASSPNGKVYRIEKGKATEFYAPQARYIWALAFGPDGSLFVGTGDQGKIFRVDASGHGELYFDSGQAHVTALAVDGQGRLLAGSEPNGLIYRIAGREKAFVIYDANLPEIRRILPAAGGDLLAVALGGSAMAKAAAAAAANQAAMAAAGGTAVTTITVDASAQAGPDLKPKLDASKQTAAQAQVTSSMVPIVDMTGVEKSAVYRIHPDNTVDTVWSSKEENAYDLLPSGADLYVSTDGQGRIYRLTADRRTALGAQLNEGETTRLVGRGGGVLAATADMGKLYRLGPEPTAAGTYEAPVHDAATAARWGRISWRGKGGVAFQTRSGNSARPDKTWSEWSAPLRGPDGGQIPSPNARFIQWRVQLTAGTAEPSVENVSVAYLPQNNPPVVKAISVSTVAASGSSGSAKPATVQQPATASYSITVTDTGEAGASTLTGTAAQTLNRPGGQQMQIAWQAEDQDGDHLVYAVYFRGEDEHDWKLLKAHLTETTLNLDADSLADGRYFFRVVASDRLANAPGMAKESDLISPPVVIDNTPPMITMTPPQRNGGRVEISVQAADSASRLRRCEYSLDAGTWVPLDAVDGVIDSRHEEFRLAMNGVTAGEHVLVIRAYDSAGNAGLAKIILR